MIELCDDDLPKRRDIVSVCGNCGAVNASHIRQCKMCASTMLRKRQVLGLVHNLPDDAVPCMVLTKDEMLNRWVPQKIIEQLTDEKMILVARLVEVACYQLNPDVVRGAALKLFDKQ